MIFIEMMLELVMDMEVDKVAYIKCVKRADV